MLQGKYMNNSSSKFTLSIVIIFLLNMGYQITITNYCWVKVIVLGDCIKCIFGICLQNKTRQTCAATVVFFNTQTDAREHRVG